MVSPALRREASCTAGRANFITGELPIRTGLTTVGQAGSPLGMPDEAPTIATVLKTMGYATGQFGKNHLGDLNQFLPTLHGFDEFFRVSLPPGRDGGLVPSQLPADTQGTASQTSPVAGLAPRRRSIGRS